jgi:DNA/RNA-binding protein KIN17
MPKAEKGTPKDIANRAKAKGLCKLKFYCQMCQKQCRDENGFKCHLTSDSHLRQMKIFQDNPDRVMDSFSKEFESSYLETLKRRHSTMKVNANHVYQEVIRERHHIHMNATCWATLSDFVQYLGRVHKCLVEETERGWYVQYIDRDPTLLARQEAARKRAEAERLEEQRHAKRMEEIRRQAVAKENGGVLVQKPTEILPQKSDSAGSQLAPVTVALAPPPPGVLTIGTKKKKSLKTSLWEEDEDENNDENIGEKVDEVLNEEPKRNNNMSSRKRRWDYSAAATTTSQDEPTAAGTENQKQIKESTNPISSSANLKEVRKKYWIYQNIIVRVITKHLANGEYYKRKGKVTKVVDKYTAEVEILDPEGGDILKLDQDDLETVIPKVIGEKVLIVNGKGRGNFAKVVRLDTNRYKADLELLPTGAQERHLIENVDFEDFCKTI